MKEEGVKTVSTWIGSGVPRFYLPLDQVFPQTNVSQLIVLAKDLKVRERLRIKLPALLAAGVSGSARTREAAAQRTAGAVPGAIPSGRHRPGAVARRADEVKAVLRENANMRGVNDNWNESVKVMRLEVDQAKARALGVTSQAIAQASKTILRHHGGPVPRKRQADRHRAAPVADERRAITDIGNAYLPTTSGRRSR
jgi:multidrug efflux pump